MVLAATADERQGTVGLALNSVVHGDAYELVERLDNESVDVVVTSPPYWGQRLSNGVGVEVDPREYLRNLTTFFDRLMPKVKPDGLVWINLGDSYNTPVNWRLEDKSYSSLGPNRTGLGDTNSAYVKPRAKRKAFLDGETWLSYGNLLAIPQRLTIAMCDAGWLFRGEVVWRKSNAMPEGKCRRPHRQHEPILLFARTEAHRFRTSPPVPSVWEFPNERIDGPRHFSRFPIALPTRAIEAIGETSPNTMVLDPFAGSGTTGLAALKLGCTFIGFEIDPDQVDAANARLKVLDGRPQLWPESLATTQ